MKSKFVFRPVVSTAKMFFQAMQAAMLPKRPEESGDAFPTGASWGNSGHEKMPHISEVAHLSKHERRKRRRVFRLSTRKRR